jgi:hypothetical protein
MSALGSVGGPHTCGSPTPRQGSRGTPLAPADGSPVGSSQEELAGLRCPPCRSAALFLPGLRPFPNARGLKPPWGGASRWYDSFAVKTERERPPMLQLGVAEGATASPQSLRLKDRSARRG